MADPKCSLEIKVGLPKEGGGGAGGGGGGGGGGLFCTGARIPKPFSTWSPNKNVDSG